jgi:hypothetical protein
MTGAASIERLRGKEKQRMKITGNGDLPHRIQYDQTAFSPPVGANGFGEIFKQTLARAAEAGPASSLAASGSVASPRSVAEHSSADRLEGFIDLLEGYCRKLANPRVGLTGLEASVQQLEEGRNALARELGTLPEGDGLKDVMNQTLVTAEVEIMRFRRGDYLAA